jgi:hypothetical protein
MMVAPQRSERVTVPGAGRGQQLSSTVHHLGPSAPGGQNSRPNFAGTDAATRWRDP